MVKKEIFVSALKTLKEDYSKRVNKAELLSEVFEGAFEANLLEDVDSLVDTIVDLICEQDDDDISMVYFFMFNLDFGRNYKEGIFKVNDIDVKIDTEESLWEYLVNKDKYDES